MTLKGRKRLLPASHSTKEIPVFGKEPDATVGFENPPSVCPGQSDLRLKRPTVGTQIDQTIWIVLAGRYDHRQACSQNSSGLVLCKFTRREGRTADQVDCESRPQIRCA